MGKAKISDNTIKTIVALRKKGHSITEINKIIGKANTTVYRYIKGVEVPPKYRNLLKSKQGGSYAKSQALWTVASKEATNLLRSLSQRDKLLILTALYWGEGNKTELNLNNSDPALIKVFVLCLKSIGVHRNDLRITLRLYEDINEIDAKIFWAKLLGIPKSQILGVNVLTGKKKGKLRYGMCRIRVTKGGRYFKLIMSMIDFIKSELNAAVVQRIERGTPKP